MCFTLSIDFIFQRFIQLLNSQNSMRFLALTVVVVVAAALGVAANVQDKIVWNATSQQWNHLPTTRTLCRNYVYVEVAFDNGYAVNKLNGEVTHLWEKTLSSQAIVTRDVIALSTGRNISVAYDCADITHVLYRDKAIGPKTGAQFKVADTMNNTAVFSDDDDHLYWVDMTHGVVVGRPKLDLYDAAETDVSLFGNIVVENDMDEEGNFFTVVSNLLTGEEVWSDWSEDDGFKEIHTDSEFVVLLNEDKARRGVKRSVSRRRLGVASVNSRPARSKTTTTGRYHGKRRSLRNGKRLRQDPPCTSCIGIKVVATATGQVLSEKWLRDPTFKTGYENTWATATTDSTRENQAGSTVVVAVVLEGERTNMYGIQPMLNITSWADSWTTCKVGSEMSVIHGGKQSQSIGAVVKCGCTVRKFNPVHYRSNPGYTVDLCQDGVIRRARDVDAVKFDPFPSGHDDNYVEFDGHHMFSVARCEMTSEAL